MSGRTPAARESARLGARAAGSALGAAFGAAGVLRRGKPLHPEGIAYDALIRRTGSPVEWRCRWLDEPGDDAGTGAAVRVNLPAE